MANARKCDRCGAFYQPRYDDDKIINEIRASATVYDVCPKCASDFIMWLRNNVAHPHDRYIDELAEQIAMEQDNILDDPYEDGGL